ncbi:MAG: uroporphyrinogen-III synthase [Bradymonadia bacterium]
MPHLSIINVNVTPWTDATIKSVNLLSNADIVFSQILDHPVLKAFASPKTLRIKAEDLAGQLEIKHFANVDDLKIVYVNTSDASLDPASFIKQLSEDESGFEDPRIQHIDGDLPWLSSLPHPSNVRTRGIRILIDVERDLNLTPPRVHSSEYAVHALIYHNLTGLLERLNVHAANFKLPTPTQTISLPKATLKAQQNLPRITTPHDLQDLSDQSLVYVGLSIDELRLSHWQPPRHLLGRNLLITRAQSQQAPLFQRLTDLGAHVKKLSLTQFSSVTGQRQTLMYENVSHYQWLIFTSVNAVTFFFKGLAKAGHTKTVLNNLKIACVGPTTEACLKAHGCQASLVPSNFTSEGLLEAFSKIPIQQVKILLPRAQIARESLPVGLRTMGAELDVVTIYEKELVDTAPDTWNNLNVLKMDGVLFCASSAVQAMEKWITEANMDNLKTTVQAFCIGPSTATTARELGYTKVEVANDHTIDGLVDSIVNFNFEQHS